MTLHKPSSQFEPAKLQDMHPHMPYLAPMPMQTQNLRANFADPNAYPQSLDSKTLALRFFTFGTAFAITIALIGIMADWFAPEGYMASEWLLMALVGFSTFWIALSVATSIIGLVVPKNDTPAPAADALSAQDVALLIPIFEEDAEAVFGRVKAMRNALAARPTNHRFSIFILSDTQNAETAQQEQLAFNRLTGEGRSAGGVPVFYRRRRDNIERKTGNIRDWVCHWGSAWNAFITLDADSLMSARAIIRLADELSISPATGLIQTVPRLISAQTVAARVLQFANNVYGNVLASGLERWSGIDGNYWGHNAIIRTRAFATSAGLPHLSGTGPLSGTIKSHDFVEAALLRRAGWSVRMLPQIEESYEEVPQTMVDYVLRDRRWCQGNLQHLRLLLTPGLPLASRFHMLQGAMSYISSLVWFVLLIVWTLMGRSEDQNIIRYFTDSNPLFPQWPHVDAVGRTLVLALVFALLLTPKLLGLLCVASRDWSLRDLGGPARFLLSSFLEIVLSFILAPIMMVQHVVAVMRTAIGLDAGWCPQNRQTTHHSLSTLLRFHWLETAMGVILTLMLASQLVSIWLLPVAGSLLLAVPISSLTGRTIKTGSLFSSLLTTKENWAPSRILTLARLSTTKKPEIQDGIPASPSPVNGTMRAQPDKF